MITVAHLRQRLFERTETFIYNMLGALEAVRVVGICQNRVNGDAFPIGMRIHEASALSSTEVVVRKAARRLLGYDAPSWLSASRVVGLLRGEGASLLHAHFGPTGFHALRLRTRLGVPLFTSFYGVDLSSVPRKGKWLERYAALFAQGCRFLVEGPVMAGSLASLGCPSDRIRVLRIGIRPEQYPFRARRGWDGVSPAVLFACASFREKKGLEYGLRAVAQVRRKHPNVVLRLAGDGPLRGRLEEVIAAEGLGDAVRLLGYVSHEEMVGEMAGADLFLQPSVTAEDGDTEGGAPTTILEAQACGLPVVATTHADIPNVVASETRALLAEERSSEQLAHTIEQLLFDKALYRTVSCAGREFVVKHHDVRKLARSLEAHYEEVLGG